MILRYLNIEIYYNFITKEIILWHFKGDNVIDWTDRVMTDKAIDVEYTSKSIGTVSMKQDPNDGQSRIEYYGYEGNRESEIFISEDGAKMEFQNSSTVMGEWQSFDTVLPVLIKDEKGSIDTERFGNRIFKRWFPYNTEFNHRILQLNTDVSADYILSYYNQGSVPTGCNELRSVGPQFHQYEPVNLLLADNGLNPGIFNKYHRNTVRQVNEGKNLTCVLMLKSEDILGMVNMTEGKDWRTAVHIDGKNYRVLELEQLDGNIYKGRFQEVYL
jgi:hypothetical protein